MLTRNKVNHLEDIDIDGKMMIIPCAVTVLWVLIGSVLIMGQ
jgi:hypothetical protein